MALFWKAFKTWYFEGLVVVCVFEAGLELPSSKKMRGTIKGRSKEAYNGFQEDAWHHGGAFKRSLEWLPKRCVAP